MGDAAVMREIVAEDVGAEAVNGEKRIHDVARRFRHSLATKCPVCVRQNLSWRRKVKSHEEGWPVYAMESGYELSESPKAEQDH